MDSNISKNTNLIRHYIQIPNTPSLEYLRKNVKLNWKKTIRPKKCLKSSPKQRSGFKTITFQQKFSNGILHNGEKSQQIFEGNSF